MAEVEEFGAELADFRKRVEELRAARALPVPEHLPALDAALFELQHAAEVLWPRYKELAATTKRDGGRGDAHEQQLLRALFQRLPVAVALLDRDGVVRRLNVTATQLFGMREGYATGRALAGSLTHEGRATFRSQVAAVARGEGARSLRVHLLRTPRPADRSAGELRATLTALRPPHEPRTAVLSLFQSAAGTPAPPDTTMSGAPQAERTGTPGLEELSRHAELLDLIDDMAATLLAAPARRKAVSDSAAAVLRGRFADWVIVDIVQEDGTLRRCTVLAPPGTVRDAVAAQEPASAPLVADAVEHGLDVLQVRPETPEALGVDVTGAPVLVSAEVSSLICVPLSADCGSCRGTAPEQAYSAGDSAEAHALEYGAGARDAAPVLPERPRALGALTLLRTGDRRPFELAEAGAVDRMARHMAIALRRSER